jgi:hypothetical protein
MSQYYKGLAIPEYVDAADGPMAFQSFVDSGPVPRFADATARDIGIPTPVEGQVAYRLDINRIDLFDGTAWTPTALPLAGGTMTGDVNMNGNKITNLPDPDGTQQPVPLAFADARYRNVTETIPFSSIREVPHGDDDTFGIVKVFDALDSVSNTAALSAGKGKYLMDNKLKVINPEVQGTITADEFKMNNGWRFNDTADFVVMDRPGGVNTYVWELAGFRPSDDGIRDLGGSTKSWRNLHYTGSLIKGSSATLKTDVEVYPFDALGIVNSVTPKRFRWKDTEVEDIGFIAEDMPTPIRRTIDGVSHLVPDQMIVTLWQAVRQLSERLDNLGI